jgi:hypothetical protein
VGKPTERDQLWTREQCLITAMEEIRAVCRVKRQPLPSDIADIAADITTACYPGVKTGITDNQRKTALRGAAWYALHPWEDS